MPEKFKRTVLCGLGVAAMTFEETLDAIVAAVREGFTGECRILTTVNVDFLVNGLSMFSRTPRNPRLMAILRKSPLTTADGMPLVLLAKLMGDPLPERVTGADLTPGLAARAAEEGLRLYFLGGTEESTGAAAEILRKKHPGLQIVGIDTPRVKLDDDPATLADNQAVCDRVNRAKPDILLVGFGNPKQELWTAKNAENLHVPIAMGVGGTFNFISGRTKRAPRWMQISGLEWIFRMIQEPRRLWKRYGWGLIKFGMIATQCLFGYGLGQLFGRPSEKVWVESEPGENAGVWELDCRGLSRLDNPARLRLLRARIQADARNLPLRLKNVSLLAWIQIFGHRL